MTSILPVPNPCLSFWQQTTRSFPLLHHGSSTPLPPTADAVIIGSGLTGALIAHELLKSGWKGKLVMLEAREAVSGATGRNAGHIRRDAFRGFSLYSALHSPAQALAILASETRCQTALQEWLKREQIPGDCDVVMGKTFDVVMTEEFGAFAEKALREFDDAGGDVSDVRVLGQEEARKETRIPGALGAYEWSAGQTHPSKITHHLLTQSHILGMHLHTHTPVTHITGTSPSWTVHTPRGTITTPLIIHATNAYASHLLPFLTSSLTPCKAQAHTVIPPRQFSGSSLLTHTYSIRYSATNFYSLIQRPSDGVMILGPSRGVDGLGEEVRRGLTGNWDDTRATEEVGEVARGRLGEVMEGWGREGEGEGEVGGWSGIIGMTKDSVPFVGETHLKGQWICAGHGGHGMARIFLCAPAIVTLLLGGTWEETGLPECYRISRERLGMGVEEVGEEVEVGVV